MGTAKIPLGKYRHFKGSIVEAIGVAKHSETLEDMVVYRHPEGEMQGLWVRPLKMFREVIERDGKKMPRFKYIENKK